MTRELASTYFVTPRQSDGTYSKEWFTEGGVADWNALTGEWQYLLRFRPGRINAGLGAEIDSNPVVTVDSVPYAEVSGTPGDEEFRVDYQHGSISFGPGFDETGGIIEVSYCRLELLWRPWDFEASGTPQVPDGVGKRVVPTTGNDGKLNPGWLAPFTDASVATGAQIAHDKIAFQVPISVPSDRFQRYISDWTVAARALETWDVHGSHSGDWQTRDGIPGHDADAGFSPILESTPGRINNDGAFTTLWLPRGTDRLSVLARFSARAHMSLTTPLSPPKGRIYTKAQLVDADALLESNQWYADTALLAEASPKKAYRDLILTEDSDPSYWGTGSVDQEYTFTGLLAAIPALESGPAAVILRFAVKPDFNATYTAATINSVLALDFMFSGSCGREPTADFLMSQTDNTVELGETHPFPFATPLNCIAHVVALDV